MAVLKVSELVRERETLKYASSLLAGLRLDKSRREPDSALAAFAELALLRIGATRTLISIFDCGYQYIVAEAIAPHKKHESEETSQNGFAPTDNNDTSRTATPWMVDRKTSLCEHVVTESSLPPQYGEEPTQSWVQENGDDLPVSVIPDASQHAPIGCDIAHRCYTGVPIQTERGINIGVLCAFGSESSALFDDASIAKLKVLSKTIMDYLETRRSADSHRRADRMVRGIGSLVDGSTAGMSWQDGLNAAALQADDSEETQFDGINDAQAEPSHNVAAQLSRSLDATSLSERPAAVQRRLSSLTTGSNHNHKQRTFSQSSSTQIRDFAPTNPVDTTGPQQVSDIFERASSIIRDSVEIEGVVFFDASVTTIRHPNAGDVSDGNTSTEPNSRSSSCSFSSGRSGSIPRNPPSAEDGPFDPSCPTLGLADSEDCINSGQHLMTEAFLKRLLRRHPKGKVYDFNDEGSLQTSDLSDDGEDGTRDSSPDSGDARLRNGTPSVKQQKRRKDEGDRVASIFPGARSVLFFPLWDARKQRWYAGGFAYTCTPTRFFSTRDELPFLLAFGATVMTEVFRSDAARVDVVKTNILNSISHELRSPLHGIVLGAELMHDTQLSAFQEDVLHSVETCGRTLLDVIDQLMDWSKVKNVKQTNQARGRERLDFDNSGPKSDVRRRSVEGGMMCTTSEVSLDVLTEEVVESVYAGYTFQRLSYEDFNTSEDVGTHPLKQLDKMKAFETIGSQAYQGAASTMVLGDFSVTLDIDASVPWLFHTQPGSIRRIIMNLVGNSLKFTKDGAVHVRLRQTTLPPSRRNHPDLQQVEIIVTDSGCGISDEYLKHRLYTAFSQENELIEGVGLGLSLVKQLVRSLGGKIKIQSQPGKGTCIAVSLPLEPIKPRPTMSAEETGSDDWKHHVEGLKGLRVRILGFPSHSVQSLSVCDTVATVDEHQLMVSICRDWLGMEVVDDEQALKPDLLLVSERELPRVQSSQAAVAPVVVVSSNPATARRMSRTFKLPDDIRGDAIVDFTSQPVGPRKLAKTLSHTFQRWIAKQAALSPRDPEPSLSISITSTVASASASATLPVTKIVEKAVQCASAVTGLEPEFLLVEDNAINMKILESYMKKLKMPYATAKDGQQAVDAFTRCIDNDNNQLKCILMDISMPVMDGFQATQLIRSLETQKAKSPCLIFALTGLASTEAQDEAFASGVDLFLTKPVKLKDLTEILKSRGLCT